MGIELAPDEVAYRCNLVTIGADGTMVDFAAGHLASEQSHPIVAALDAALGDGRDGVRFHAGVEYRHLVVVPGDWADADCVPPHDLTGKPAVWPTGPAAPQPAGADGRVATGRRRGGGRGRLDRDADLAVGPGPPPAAARLRQPLRRRAAGSTSAVDLVRGLGVLAGIEVLDVPGATAGFDNDYAAQRDRVHRLARRPRLLPAPRRGHRRGRPPAGRGREGRGARGLGPGDHRPAARGAARPSARSGSCCCPTTRPRSSSAPTPPSRCRTCSTTASPRWSGGPTPSRPRPTARRWPPTPSWPGWSRPPDVAPMMTLGATPPDPQRSGSSLG